MRKIKAHIKTSPDRNLTFKVYRDTVESNLPPAADLLSLLTPVMSVKEQEVQKKAYLISEEEAALDVTSIITADFIPYTIRHNMLKDILHQLIVKITYNDGTVKRWNVKFNNDETIASIKDELGADYNASQIFDLSYRNLIMIKDTFILDALTVKASYFTEMIEVVDYTDVQVGVDYTGPIPTGTVDTTLTSIVKTVTENGLTMPYFELTPTATTAPQEYCYRLLAFDNMNNISDPSDLMKISLQQPVAELKLRLQSCPDPTVANPVWTDIGLVVKSGLAVDYGKYGTPEYTSFGGILANQVVPQMNQSNITAIYSDVQTSVTLAFDNPWRYTQYTKRKTKALRLKATFDTVNDISVFSAPTTQLEVDVNIDSVKILRCEVADPTRPFDFGAADTVGMFCLNNGRLYNDAISASINPVLVAQLDTGSTTYNGEINIPYVPMNANGGGNRLTLVDDNVAPGKHYKYAIILEDSMKNTSTPTYRNAVTII